MFDPPDSRLAPSFLPATAVLEVTRRCNHRCGFCSCPWEAGDNSLAWGAEMTTEEWKSIIRDLCARGVGNLSFTGGEALLKEGILDLLRFASCCRSESIHTADGELISETKPPALFLISNGTTISAEILEFIRDTGVHLSISLPGLTTLRDHTGIGDPDEILGKFRMARALGLRTTVNVTVTRKNLPELYHTLSAAFLAGASHLLLNRFLPGGRGLRHAADLALGAAEVRRMLEVAEEALADAGCFGSVGTELPRCLVDPAKHKHLTVGTRCAAAVGFFVIGPDGYARVCNHSPVRLVHARDLDQLKGHSYWQRFVLKDYLPPTCLGCRWSKECDGGCREAAHITSGSPDAPDPVGELYYAG